MSCQSARQQLFQPALLNDLARALRVHLDPLPDLGQRDNVLGRDDAHSNGRSRSRLFSPRFGDRFESAEGGFVQRFSYDFDRVFGSMLINEADSTGASHESSLPQDSPCVRLCAKHYFREHEQARDLGVSEAATNPCSKTPSENRGVRSHTERVITGSTF